MKNVKTLAVGRPVKVRFGSDWRVGVVSSNDGRGVVVQVKEAYGVYVSIHSSVIRRDLRMA